MFLYSVGGLPDYASIVDHTGRVRRRALVPENQDYQDRDTQGSDDDDCDHAMDITISSKGHHEEEEFDDDSSDGSDVDNLVPRSRHILNRQVLEPPSKRRKIEVSCNINYRLSCWQVTLAEFYFIFNKLLRL